MSETEESKNVDQEQKNVLLGAISYSDDSEYNEFLSNLDVHQSLFVLIASANFSQSRGAFNLDEAELVSKAIKVLKKVSSPVSEDKAEPSEES